MKPETLQRMRAVLGRMAEDLAMEERGVPPCGELMATVPGIGAVHCTRPAGHAPGENGPGHFYLRMACALAARLAPPELPGIPDDTMLAVAAVPGKILEEWRHAALGAWMAWPHAADAVHAEEMTAAQLRAILAAREAG